VALLRRWPAVAGCLVAVGLGAPSAQAAGPVDPPAPQRIDLHLPAHPGTADLRRVQALVTDLTTRSARAAAGVQAAATQDLQLRLDLQTAGDRAGRAQGTASRAVRAAYEATEASSAPVGGWITGTDLMSPELARAAGARGARPDVAAARAATAAQHEYLTLVTRADVEQRRLLRLAAPVAQLEGEARDALDQAQVVFAQDQQAAAALAASAAQLAAQSRAVALAVTPAVTSGGRVAASAQAPLLALLDRTPMGALPQGFAVVSTLTGVSSWYGPGFVGSPTSSGSPYDPEQLTCAMLTVPLGTLVRVSVADGRAVTVLVTDHGPYVGGRLIDLSARAARVLGVGVTPVRVDVLRTS